jgi:hypothetical protein
MSAPGEEERRKYDRFPFREDILIDGMLCSSMDISEGGLYLSAIQPFKEGSIIELTIPFKENRITVRARVCYSQAGIGMGIKFIELSDRQRVMIKDMVESIASRQ